MNFWWSIPQKGIRSKIVLRFLGLENHYWGLQSHPGCWIQLYFYVLKTILGGRIMNALSFCRPKMILDRPNCFGQIQIVLVMPKSFWSDLNHFGQVQIRLFWTNFYDLDPTKKIGPVQNNWYSTKMIWTVQNHFGSMEG